MNDSTNVRIIADNIRKLEKMAKDAESKIPTPAAGDTGKILKVGSDGYELATDYATIGYSSTETDTGLTWIDGKKIYSRSFEGTTPETAGNLTVGTLGEISTLIHMFGSCSEAAHPERLRLLERMYAPTVAISTGEIVLSVAEGYVSSYYNLTVLYTKPDPAPTNETKKKTTKKG